MLFDVLLKSFRKDIDQGFAGETIKVTGGIRKEKGYMKVCIQSTTRRISGLV